jgi:hypothetical protein
MVGEDLLSTGQDCRERSSMGRVLFVEEQKPIDEEKIPGASIENA